MNRTHRSTFLALAALLLIPVARLDAAEAPRVVEAEVCVYGGTSGGVVAAVQAARMGKSVVLVEPGRHLGGMTSGGLSAVDIGDPRSVGGVAREYFTRLAATVGKELAWDRPFESKHGGPATGGAYAIEPHKAEQLFDAMAREAGVAVHREARLAKVNKEAARITELVADDGTLFRAKVFLDTTYEGDLMAAAGVSYTLLREGNARYGETYNGIHYTEKYRPRTEHLQPGPNGRVPGGQGVWDRDFPLDPYVVKGDPTSGLLPLVNEGEPGVQGEPAPGVQAYCYRLCLTTDPDNRQPIAPPPDYDPKRYEIVVRFIEACQANGDDMDLRWFSKHDPLPNEKWDFNTATFGGNLPGASWEWPEAGYARRAEIAKQHENYHRGLLHFLATDPQVPEKVRNEMKSFGLPKDEFTDNGGWPHQIYVREGRRMVSDSVMTEHHTFGRKAAPRSVGLGSYGTDTHEIRRIVKDGVVAREGKTATGRGGFGPYQIGYGAIVPRQSECENLLVTFALSASHTAFSSIRMEPVFMVTSQSAATAAAMAIDDAVPVQRIDYAKLRERLLADGQVLDGAAPRAPAENPAASERLSVVDLSGDTSRQVVIALGTPEIYQGHPTTVLLPDGKTMFAVWTYGHGGVCGPMKRSDDGGLTWSELLDVPESWKTVRNCPSIYRMPDPQGKMRLLVYASTGPDGAMYVAASEDDGRSWGEMRSTGLKCVMPLCTIEPIDGGKMLLGMTNLRRPGETEEKRSNVVAQSISTDGGLTWAPWQIVCDIPGLVPCEPELVRSPDGKTLLCLMRENKLAHAMYMTSTDEGATWSVPKRLPPGLVGDRHKAHYTPDGRLVVCMRDRSKKLGTYGHFVAWVGRFEDIVEGRGGQYRIKLLHSNAGSDCGYPGLELLPDGTLVATTYVKHRPGPDKHSVVSVRFKLDETDKLARQVASAPPSHAGIVMDDDAGEYTGDWVESSRQPSLLGGFYRHDNHREPGKKSVRFTPTIPEAGPYEVRLLYPAHPNRATNAPVTIRSDDGEKTVTVNQREEVLVDGVPRALGVFRFEAGKRGSVTVTNAGADGYVIVDGLQLVPVEIAKEERAGKRDAGFHPESNPTPDQAAEERRARMAAAVAFSPLAPAGTEPSPAAGAPDEPVRLAKAAKPEEVDGRRYDLVVVGGTGAGVACAVRAAREGCSVLLVQHNQHIGGMMINGLMQWDALYGGPRSAVFSELLRGIERHYVAAYGENSRDHQTIRYTHEHYPIGWAEPHVAEREFNRLVAAERHITLLLGYYPTAVERGGTLLQSVTLREYGGTKQIRVRGLNFADATYEGDLFALARVPYRCGREAREEYDEPHAGKLFCNIAGGPAPRAAVEGLLNIRPYGAHQGTIDPTSPFTADRCVQAYNYRFCVTCDPDNRIMVDRPPPGYDREEYVHYNRKGIATNSGPNRKSHMNSPILPGENHDYPEADWPTREKIIQRHLNFALGLIYFLQNDESVSPAQRKRFRQWGLPKDEFADNGHIPYEMYVREARRIVGRHVYTEHDNSLAEGIGRTPVFADSVAVTDWYMDSHACTTESRPGYHYDGKLILTEESRPGQIPYRALLPQGVDNLLVPLGLSATHIAWGAIRLEPVWMQTGEAAGCAAALAKRRKTTPAELDADLLVRTLARKGQLVSFFNDLRVDGKEPWIAAVEYFGTKGFFATYDARPEEPLTEPVARVWAEGFSQLRAGKLDAAALAREVAAADAPGLVQPITAKGFQAMLPGAGNDAKDGPITRAEACRMMFDLIEEGPTR